MVWYFMKGIPFCDIILNLNNIQMYSIDKRATHKVAAGISPVIIQRPLPEG